MENDCSRTAGAPFGFVGTALPMARIDYLSVGWFVGAMRTPSAQDAQPLTRNP
jgi:hypothetical protein